MQNLQTYAGRCKVEQAYVYFDTIKEEYELCCCCCCSEHKSAYLVLEKAQLHIQEGQCYFAVFSPWLYELSPSNPTIITVISPLIYSNAVSHLWGNYEHFFFVARRDLSAPDKRDSALKENALREREKEREREREKKKNWRNRWAAISSPFPSDFSLCIRLANCLQVYITELSMRRGFRISPSTM